MSPKPSSTAPTVLIIAAGAGRGGGQDGPRTRRHKSSGA
jgi:hypothetical protein